MRREIKFRGQDVETKKWRCGDYLHIDDDFEICDHSTVFYNRYDVLPETIGQYTGLNDKNGVEIYEGDILSGSNGSVNGYVWPFKQQIKYDKRKTEFNVPTWAYDLEGNYCGDSTHYFEVIGNIHDTPELLK